jgi:hypothetical protein
MNDKDFEQLYIITFVVGLTTVLFDLFLWRP